MATLRAGCLAWLQMALDPVIQRIVLVDAPAVVGWKRLREIDEQRTLGGLSAPTCTASRARGRLAAGRGRRARRRIPDRRHSTKPTLLIALAPDPQAALRVGQAAVNTLISHLTRN